ncbi:CysH 3'-phosphoadenosine 5'-phosphosulfate sulfotransferase (PAPS reductase)/FAD synthetase and related enzymes [Burkholderiaceae bacterium]
MTTIEQYGFNQPQVWSTELAYQKIEASDGTLTKRTAERQLQSLDFLPAVLTAETLQDEHSNTPTPSVIDWQLDNARKARKLVLFIQLKDLPDGTPCLHANDARGARYWLPMPQLDLNSLSELNKLETIQKLTNALHLLQQFLNKELAVFPHAEITSLCRLIDAGPNTGSASIQLCMLGYAPVLDLSSQHSKTNLATGLETQNVHTSHLKHLEDESIHILREAVAEAENPVMMYSVGKDSSVMLHLARKAFYPAPPPFPLLHVDTRWKFQEMYLFRDYMSQQSGMKLLVHINPDAIARSINPFDHGSSLHTDITKTEGLKQALDKHKFDVIFGGARRDEEKSRAKERIFSFRTKNHIWDPKNQRPELWSLYNTRKSQGESIRVFPISNWTELDIWQYIYQEAIPVVPLYFAKTRPVIERDGMLMLVDDARTQLLPGEQIQARQVRFRTLGCYPLTGAVESNAQNLSDIILELIAARSSERQGRAIDKDSSGSMEKKKQAGYF